MSTTATVKHTPGPWTLNPSTSGGLILVRGGGDWKAHPQTHLQILPEADARLIAAAPELLEALRGFANAFDAEALFTGDIDAGLVLRSKALLARIDGDGQ